MLYFFNILALMPELFKSLLHLLGGQEHLCAASTCCCALIQGAAPEGLLPVVMAGGCQRAIQGGPPGFIHQQGMAHAQPLVTPACVAPVTCLSPGTIDPNNPLHLHMFSQRM